MASRISQSNRVESTNLPPQDTQIKNRPKQISNTLSSSAQPTPKKSGIAEFFSKIWNWILTNIFCWCVKKPKPSSESETDSKKTSEKVDRVKIRIKPTLPDPSEVDDKSKAHSNLSRNITPIDLKDRKGAADVSLPAGEDQSSASTPQLPSVDKPLQNDTGKRKKDPKPSAISSKAPVTSPSMPAASKPSFTFVPVSKPTFTDASITVFKDDGESVVSTVSQMFNPPLLSLKEAQKNEQHKATIDSNGLRIPLGFCKDKAKEACDLLKTNLDPTQSMSFDPATSSILIKNTQEYLIFLGVHCGFASVDIQKIVNRNYHAGSLNKAQYLEACKAINSLIGTHIRGPYPVQIDVSGTSAPVKFVGVEDTIWCNESSQSEDFIVDLLRLPSIVSTYTQLFSPPLISLKEAKENRVRASLTSKGLEIPLGFCREKAKASFVALQDKFSKTYLSMECQLNGSILFTSPHDCMHFLAVQCKFRSSDLLSLLTHQHHIKAIDDSFYDASWREFEHLFKKGLVQGHWDWEELQQQKANYDKHTKAEQQASSNAGKPSATSSKPDVKEPSNPNKPIKFIGKQETIQRPGSWSSTIFATFSQMFDPPLLSLKEAQEYLAPRGQVVINSSEMRISLAHMKEKAKAAYDAFRATLHPSEKNVSFDESTHSFVVKGPEYLVFLGIYLGFTSQTIAEMLNAMFSQRANFSADDYETLWTALLQYRKDGLISGPKENELLALKIKETASQKPADSTASVAAKTDQAAKPVIEKLKYVGAKERIVTAKKDLDTSIISTLSQAFNPPLMSLEEATQNTNKPAWFMAGKGLMIPMTYWKKQAKEVYDALKAPISQLAFSDSMSFEATTPAIFIKNHNDYIFFLHAVCKLQSQDIRDLLNLWHAKKFLNNTEYNNAWNFLETQTFYGNISGKLVESDFKTSKNAPRDEKGAVSTTPAPQKNDSKVTVPPQPIVQALSSSKPDSQAKPASSTAPAKVPSPKKAVDSKVTVPSQPPVPALSSGKPDSQAKPASSTAPAKVPSPKKADAKENKASEKPAGKQTFPRKFPYQVTIQKGDKNAGKAINEHIDNAGPDEEFQLKDNKAEFATEAEARPSLDLLLNPPKLSKPLTCKVAEHQEQGPRDTMEDAHFVKETENYLYAAVFDGHGDSRGIEDVESSVNEQYGCNPVANYVNKQFQARFPAEIEKAGGNVHEAFEALIYALQQEVFAKNEWDEFGTTATIFYLDKKTGLCYSATVGDSETSLHRKFAQKIKTVALSAVRNWASKSDARRAAEVYEDPSTFEKFTTHPNPKKIRFLLQINVSRAIGDKNLALIKSLTDGRIKVGITAKPKIVVQMAKPGDIVLLRCDGITDYLDESFVNEQIAATTEANFATLPKRIVDAALAKYTVLSEASRKHSRWGLRTKEFGDNATVVAIQIT